MSDFRPVQSGSPLRIAADTWNAVLAVAQAYRSGGLGGTDGRTAPYDRSTILLVRNGTGSDVSKAAILGITGVELDPTASVRHSYRDPILTCGAPAAGGGGKFVVTAEPIADGAIGRAYVDGVCWAKVAIESAEAGAYTYAEIDAGSSASLLAVPTGSAKILWKADADVGTHWAVIRIGGGAAVIDRPRTVKVYKDGPEAGTVPLDGSGGYDSGTGLYHTCSYTYEVREVDGTTVIATEQTPEHARMSSTKYVAATAGTLGLWDPVTSKLLIAYKEKPSTRTDCP